MVISSQEMLCHANKFEKWRGSMDVTYAEEKSPAQFQPTLARMQPKHPGIPGAAPVNLVSVPGATVAPTGVSTVVNIQPDVPAVIFCR